MQTMAVIGAGPAGLFASIEGAKNGMEVMLFEKHDVGERINCAEGFFDFFRLLGEPEAGVLFKVNKLIFQLKVSYSLEQIPLNIWMIDRSRWQRAVADRAKGMGVRVLEREPVSSAEIKRLCTEYDWVVDARGAGAAKKNRIKDTCAGNALTFQYEMEGDFSYLSGSLKIGLEPHYFGYYWIFPKGKTRANVGLGWFNPGECRAGGLKLRHELERITEKENLGSCRVLRRSGGVIPVTPCGSMIKGNLLIVGDAAGLASPLHGGGIDMACISGRLAVQAILKNRPGMYEKNLRKLLKKRFAIEKSVLDLWRRHSWESLDRLAGAFVNRSPGLAGIWQNRRILLQEIGVLNRLFRGI